jgi:hypothetical protein
VLLGCVVGHEIQDDFQAQGVRLCDQALAIGERAEQGIDVVVIGDVIAEIGHRRLVERADPNCIHAKSCKVGKAPANAVEIAHPIAV